HSVQMGYVKTGGSYCSQSQLRLTFGLGDSSRVHSVEVAWPSGKKQVIDSPPFNQLIRIREGGS
ncbi:MAG TPA: ASPIC/UnbV domain-containing protein, partial [Acidobacteriota bacterium]|nr:ASPIC/UnbV domain-containing protein [Acidobacteriota bacterium]